MTTQPKLFAFDDPIPVIDKAEILSYFESAIYLNKYYTTPINFTGLAKAFHSTSYHSTAITVKKNILLSTLQTSSLISRLDLERFILDYLIFGNAYFYIHKNKLGKPVRLQAMLAKYIRKGVKDGIYYQVTNFIDDFEFPKDSIYHFIQPDFNQEIYGLPEYLSALQSSFLNEAATLFRRKYYINGAHAGSIIYLTDPLQSEASIDNLEQQIKSAKGKGNFKNLFIYSPNGKEKGLQVIPLSDITAKDEFLNIKNTSRDDILAAHRVPPQLLGIIPNNTGGFGDVEKAGKVFFINEIEPLQRKLNEINVWFRDNYNLQQDLIKFSKYRLLDTEN
ncbi:phage portal protein [Gallibacterium genomosp. 3]|nr:phage portal protein [Gallibacterium genomosp. 3]